MLQLNENKQFAFFQRLAFPLRIFLLILVFSIFVIAALAQYFTASFEDYLTLHVRDGNDSNLLIVFYVQIMPDDFVMQLHRF